MKPFPNDANSLFSHDGHDQARSFTSSNDNYLEGRFTSTQSREERTYHKFDDSYERRKSDQDSFSNENHRNWNKSQQYER